MAEANVNVGKALVILLNPDNYQVWKVKAQALLMREKLWKMVTNSRPENPDEDWNEANDAALGTLTLTLGNDQIGHIRNCTTAKEAWDALKVVHERSSFGSCLYLRRRLYTMRYMGGSMQAHITSMLEIIEQLRNAEAEISIGEQVATLLLSLPEAYSNLVLSLEGLPNDKLTVSYVSNRMLDEYTRRQEARKHTERDERDVALQSSTSSSKGAKQSRIKNIGSGRAKGGWKETRECYGCGKKGHIRPNCPDLRNSRDKAAIGRRDDSKDILFSASEGARGVRRSGWIVDSGATAHMTSDRKFFSSFLPVKQEVILADGHSTKVTGIGSGVLRCVLPSGEEKPMELLDVLYAPNLDGNLISIKVLDKQGCVIHIESGKCIISSTQCDGENKVIACASGDGALYELTVAPESKCLAAEGISSGSLQLWHRRFGHRDPNAVKALVDKDLVIGMKVDKGSDREPNCIPCIKGKLTGRPFPTSISRASRPLDLIHSDLCGPMRTRTPTGNRYFLTFIDDHSRFTVIRLLKSKDEVTSTIKDYIVLMSTKFGRKPKIFRTDNGTEYVNRELKSYFRAQGIEHQQTVVYTPQQNGVAERKNRSITEMARCMLLDAKLHFRFWGEAVLTATYLQNRLPSRSVAKTPYEHFCNCRPDVSNLRIFGSKVYSYVPKERRNKWSNRAVEGVLIGFGETVKGYRLLNPKTGRVWYSRTVHIVEKGPKKSQVPKHVSLPQSTEESFVDFEEWYGSPEGAQEFSEEQSDSSNDTDSENAVFKDPAVEVDGTIEAGDDGIITPLPSLPRRGRPVKDINAKPKTPPEIRRSERLANAFKPFLGKQVQAKIVLVDHVQEPANWEQMIQLPACERVKWMEAVKEELRSLDEHHVWEISDLPQGKRAISAKWVFKAKMNGEGEVQTYKARLVARGFSQVQGRDYDETFSPVVRHDTVRVLFAVAAMKKMHVRHIDVKSAYLNGELHEELYLEKPPGLELPGMKGKVLRLKRSIYGLKQSARAWHETANVALSKIGFHRSKADPCLFIRNEKGQSAPTYVLLYVDDLLVAGASSELTRQVGQQLNRFFRIKDLGDVSHYLGIRVNREKRGSFILDQSAKIRQLLEEQGMLEAKPVATPMETSFLSTSSQDSPKMADNVRYRQVVGSLLYLATVSRPDIAVAVGILCRYVEGPTERDWKSVKRVLRYLVGTVNYKLCFPASGCVELCCYVDADWAGDHGDRKSTSGYIFQLGQCAVAWCSRKQAIVAMSSTEAEYVAASEACKELQWLRQLLDDMGELADGPTVMFEDNQGCIKLAQSDRCHQRTKHIDVRHHQLRELQETQVLFLEYCPSEKMAADGLTKPLPKDSFNRCVQHFGLK